MSSGQSRREGADAKLRRTRATRPSADKTAIRPRRLHLCGDQTVMENVLEQDTRYRRCRSDRRAGRVFPGQQAHGSGQCRALRNEERPAQRRHDPHHGSGGAIYLSPGARSSPPSTPPSRPSCARRPRSHRFPCGSTRSRRAGSPRRCRRWGVIQRAEFRRRRSPRSSCASFARAHQARSRPPPGLEEAPPTTPPRRGRPR